MYRTYRRILRFDQNFSLKSTNCLETSPCQIPLSISQQVGMLNGHGTGNKCIFSAQASKQWQRDNSPRDVSYWNNSSHFSGCTIRTTLLGRFVPLVIFLDDLCHFPFSGRIQTIDSQNGPRALSQTVRVKQPTYQSLLYHRQFYTINLIFFQGTLCRLLPKQPIFI